MSVRKRIRIDSPSANRGLRNELPFILAATRESIVRMLLGIDEGG